MRVLKVVLVGLLIVVAAIAGILVAIGVAAGGAIIFAMRRRLRSAAPNLPLPPASKQTRPIPADEVIDISATEVPAGLPRH